ncbi:Peroxisomal sarcosine oxidase, partial [Dissostichus eleginoides]
MSSEVEYDCIVIGAGVQGSFTAYQLAKRNKKTLLLEQFVLPHTRGSSHGQTRIIRKAYDQDFYTQMMDECYKLWSQLEREAGVTLYRNTVPVPLCTHPKLMTDGSTSEGHLCPWAGKKCLHHDEKFPSEAVQTGLLVMGPEHSDSYLLYKNTMERNNVPMVILTPENFCQHIPNVILAEGDGALVDINAGVLYADRALKTVQGQFQKLGGVIRDKEKVTDITPGPVVTVSTSAGVYRAKSLVITAGPWANKLLAHIGLQLPLEVEKINVCYWKEKVPGTYDVKKRFPCFLLTEGEESDKHIYGLPSNEYPGLVK